jgi:hypothetical protein
MMGRLSLALAMVCALGISTEAGGECRPAAVAAGEPTLVRELGERLAASGIATTSSPGCPAARVRVEPRGEQIRIEVTDTFGRTGTRLVHDVATAAAIVESWTSQEIDAGSMPEAPAADPAVRAARPWRDGATAAFESAAGSDGSLWLGAAITGCVRIGALCAGALARGTRDAIESSSMVHYDTQELGALATVDLPRRVGRLVITPGAALGYAYLTLAEHHLDAHSMPFDVDYTRHALVADLHASLAYPLGAHLSLYVDLRGDTALARSDVHHGPRSFARASFGVRLGGE